MQTYPLEHMDEIRLRLSDAADRERGLRPKICHAPSDQAGADLAAAHPLRQLVADLARGGDRG